MIKLPDTLQEVFDIVSTHLLKQVKRSMAEYPDRKRPVCSYRGENGTKCAAGILIPDEEYKPQFEQNSWAMLIRSGFVKKTFMREISELQSIHDRNGDDSIDYLKRELRDFARLNNLTHNIEV